MFRLFLYVGRVKRLPLAHRRRRIGHRLLDQRAQHIDHRLGAGEGFGEGRDHLIGN